VELLQFLAGRYGHVSYERILSGPGLVNVYEFLRKKEAAEEPPAFAEQTGGSNAAAAISHAALNGTNSLAERALDLWVRGLRRGSR